LLLLLATTLNSLPTKYREQTLNSLKKKQRSILRDVDGAVGVCADASLAVAAAVA
jgi:hypothetical protein